MPKSIILPAVDLASPPVPANAAFTVPDCTSKMPDENSVPFEIVPLVSVTPPF